MRKSFCLICFILCSMGMSNAYSQLLSQYDFEGSEPSVALDGVGSHNGTLVADAAKIDDAGRQSKVLTVRNWVDYVDLGTWNPSENTNELTVSLWAKWGGCLGGNDSGVVAKRDNWGPNDMMWQLCVLADGKISFGSTGGGPVSDVAMPTDQWVHLSVTYANNVGKIYLDGELIAQALMELDAGYGAKLNIGSVQSGAFAFNGRIDEVSFYDNALNSIEIQNLAGIQPDPALVAMYEFEGSDSVVAVDSVGVHNGTLVADAAKVDDADKNSKVLTVRNWVDYVDLGTWNPSENTNQLSVALWAKWGGCLGGNASGIAAKRDNWGSNDMMWEFCVMPDGKISFNSTGGGPVSDVTMPTNQWVHLAAIYANNVGKIYLNGKLIAQAPMGLDAGYGAKLNIGSVQSGALAFNGRIDDVRFYNNALSDVKVKRLAGVESDSSLLAVYEFEGSDAKTAIDSAGDHTGTLIAEAAKVDDADRQSKVLTVRNWVDYVDLGTWNPSENTNELTVGLWAKWGGCLGGNTSGIVAKRDNWGPNDMMWQLCVMPDGKISFASTAGGPASDVTMPTNQWVYLTATYSNEIAKIYLDGELIAEGSTVLDSGVNAKLNIGSIQSGAEAFNGQIDSVRFYNKALNGIQVKELVGLPLGDVMASDNATIGLWHMDSTITLGNGQLAVADDDAGTNSYTGRGHHLKLGSDSDWGACSPVLVPQGIMTNDNALSFDGVDDIAVANFTWMGEQFEFDTVDVDFWFNPASIPAEGQHAVIIGAVAWELRLKSDGLYFVTWSNDEDGLEPVEVISGPVAMNQWHHVSAQFKDGIQTLTVDGISYSTSQTSLRLFTCNVYLGQNPAESGTAYKGLIDEVELCVPDMPGVENWEMPRDDDYSTLGLWHLDGVIDPNMTGDSLLSEDDNSNNHSRKAYPALLVEGDAPATPYNMPTIIDSFDSNFGNCFRFDGTGDKLLCTSDHSNPSDDIGTSDNFRVEAWAKLNADATAYGSDLNYIIAGQPYRFMMGIQDNANGWRLIAVFWWNTGGYVLATDLESPYDWHHVACQWYKGQMSLYLDGELKDRDYKIDITDLGQAENFLAIGSFGQAGQEFWGDIDEVYITKAVPELPPCGFYGYLPGDINEDCYVDALDLVEFANQWLTVQGK